MSRSSMARVAAVAAGALASLAGAAFLRRRRLRKGGPMQDIKEIARRLTEDPWRGKLDEALKLVGDDYVGHLPGAPEPIRGKDGFREFVKRVPDGVPGLGDHRRRPDRRRRARRHTLDGARHEHGRADGHAAHRQAGDGERDHVLPDRGRQGTRGVGQLGHALADAAARRGARGCARAHLTRVCEGGPPPVGGPPRCPG